ncbi:hypothetical protein MVES1_003261 [Malassezia vespertilionis]|uniref:uncharacterized protein n=1 Tax=Malassezia vespertilionis TaxID=2020962 RepID=UPI0024B0DBF0|nr:uncharacterized protein MVES1_003261 [Malassezia vespertilionis]WFD07893.1 hypothetical protein MVES1_003261 [Malassezia vespertilionis]
MAETERPKKLPHVLRRKMGNTHVDEAYEVQKIGGLRGAAVWTIVGGSGIFVAHHIFSGFRKQPLMLKALLGVTCTSVGLVFGAESALQRYEHRQRTEVNLIRHKAMRELGQRGIIASEPEIHQWQEDLIEAEIALRRQRKAIETGKIE